MATLILLTGGGAEGANSRDIFDVRKRYKLPGAIPDFGDPGCRGRTKSPLDPSPEREKFFPDIAGLLREGLDLFGQAVVGGH